MISIVADSRYAAEKYATCCGVMSSVAVSGTMKEAESDRKIEHVMLQRELAEATHERNAVADRSLSGGGPLQPEHRDAHMNDTTRANAQAKIRPALVRVEARTRTPTQASFKYGTQAASPQLRRHRGEVRSPRCRE